MKRSVALTVLAVFSLFASTMMLIVSLMPPPDVADRRAQGRPPEVSRTYLFLGPERNTPFGRRLFETIEEYRIQFSLPVFWIDKSPFYDREETIAWNIRAGLYGRAGGVIIYSPKEQDWQTILPEISLEQELMFMGFSGDGFPGISWDLYPAGAQLGQVLYRESEGKIILAYRDESIIAQGLRDGLESGWFASGGRPVDLILLELAGSDYQVLEALTGQSIEKRILLANDFEQTLSTLQLAIDLNIWEEFQLVGWDFSPEIKESIQEGRMLGSFFLDGRALVEKLSQGLAQEQDGISFTEEIPAGLITLENVENPGWSQ